MVRFVHLVVLVLVVGNSYAQVSIYPKTIMLGLPVIMVFVGKEVESDFEKVNKSQLKKQFEIYDVDGDSNRIRLILYPKQVGILKVPAMQQGQINYQGENIVVTENDEVNVRWKAPISKTFANKVVTWQAEVSLVNAVNNVSFEQHPHFNNKLSYNLPEKPFISSSVLFGKTETFSMSIMLDKAGKTKIRSPVVKVKNATSRPWRFFDNTASLQVLPLPSYLPITTPVGRLTIVMEELPLFISTGELVNLKWQVLGEHVPTNLLPNLSQQLGYQQAVEWLSPRSVFNTNIKALAHNSEVTVSQPFRVNSAGLFTLPEMRISYFETKTQQLKDVFTQKQFVWVVPIWLVWILSSLVYLLVIVVAIVFSMVVWQAITKAILLKNLRQAKTIGDIWKHCQIWSSRMLMGEDNLSVNAWQNNVSNYFSNSESLINLTNYINQENYGLDSDKAKKFAEIWAQELPSFNIKLFRMLLLKWQNYLTVFIKRNH